MKRARCMTSVTVAVGLLALLLSPGFLQGAGSLAVIAGSVHDSGGVPVVGALVIVAASSPSMAQRMTFTDSRGGFSIPNLFGGEYSVKVTMPRFLTALKSGIQVNAGSSAFLTVNLQNALDIVRRVVDKNKFDDMVWTLRSSRSTQPILRLASGHDFKDTAADISQPDYSGYVQLYSKSVETSSGVSDGMGSQFSMTVPLDSRSRVRLAGQYNEDPTQPRGFGASYDFSPADGHRATVGINVRQGAVVGDQYNAEQKEIQLQYGENYQWSDHMVVNYGAEVGRSDALTDRNYMRPRFAVSWVPEARTTLTVGATSQAPTSPDDPIRGRDYFDRIAYVPPSMEGYAHTEMAVSRVISDKVDVSASVFEDRVDTQALFISSLDGQGVFILDSSHNPANGVRVHVNRQFRGFEAGVGYTTTTGLGVSDQATAATSLADFSSDLKQQRFHLVTARFKADVACTQTHVTAVYRWVNDFSATRLDPYQKTVEFNDPSLSLTVAQNLPNWRIIPGKVQAIVDARNLFDPTYSTKNTSVSQYPRLLQRRDQHQVLILVKPSGFRETTPVIGIKCGANHLSPIV